jgi:hypothetical protein
MGVAPLLEVKMRRRSWRRQRSRFQEEKEHYADGLDGTKKTMTMEKEEEEIDADVYSGGATVRPAGGRRGRCRHARPDLALLARSRSMPPPASHETALPRQERWESESSIVRGCEEVVMEVHECTGFIEKINDKD